jgi:cell division protein FtsW
VLCVLFLLEPDFGAAVVLFATVFGLLFLAGARLRWLVMCIVAAGAGFWALMVAAPYRVARLKCFTNPWAQADACGYQPVNSLIAIGRGEWVGVGLGDSVQKLMYLPEAHNDFLFAVLAEELGLVGVVATLALFLVLVWRVFRIAGMAADAGLRFQSLLAAGFGLWVGIQALINIGVTMSVLPTKGLTLPLMSYGRSSLLVTLVWLGLVLRVNHEAMSRTRGAASAAARREHAVGARA